LVTLLSMLVLKTCRTCKLEKSTVDFYKDKGCIGGLRPSCKACKDSKTAEWRVNNRPKYNADAVKWRDLNPERQHATDIKRHYGITGDDYARMLVEQDNKCKICPKEHNPSIKRGRLYVDHNHKTGEVRGLLCGACNSAIGYFEDCPDRLQAAIEYLK
jgi:hypothetical protein